MQQPLRAIKPNDPVSFNDDTAAPKSLNYFSRFLLVLGAGVFLGGIVLAFINGETKYIIASLPILFLGIFVDDSTQSAQH